MHFLELPYEIRLNIYEQLFGKHTVYINAGRQDAGSASNKPTLFAGHFQTSYPSECSAQVLRTCKAIFEEALPILYESTTFRTCFQAFAGKLPTQVSDKVLTFPFVRRLEWELRCDLLKRHRPEDVAITETDLANLRFVQLSCHVETWRDSCCGECVDRKSFVDGRQQLIDFAKVLQTMMSGGGRSIALIEDTRYLSKGGVVVRLSDVVEELGENVSGPKWFRIWY